MILMIIMVFKLRVGHRTGHHHFSAPKSSKGTTSLGTKRLLSAFPPLSEYFQLLMFFVICDSERRDFSLWTVVGQRK